MKDVSRREFLKTLCLGITVAALQNLPMTTAFADSAISKTKIISKSDRENLVATVARTVQVSYKIDKNTIIEVTRFTDIDGQNVTLNRSVKEDGTGELVYTKAQKTKKSKLTNQSYDVFLKLATSKSMPQTRGALLEVMLQDHSISIYLYQISAIQLTIRRLRKLRLVELKLQQAF